MQKKSNRAFTIVELVIVIAVIAVLASVLIPVFSGVIEKSKISNDKEFVRNLNTTLYLEVDRERSPKGTADALYKNGIAIENVKLQNKDGEILYDSVNDCFIYTTDGVNFEYIGVQKLQDVEKGQLYKFCSTLSKIDEEINSGYGVCYIGNEITTKFTNYKTQTYYVGNVNVFKVSDLFNNEFTADYNVRVEDLEFTYNNFNGNVMVAGTGNINLIVTYKGVTVFTLPLTVVNAKNFTTKSTSDDSDIVLLKNITNGTVTVAESYKIYDNGFTYTKG